MFGRITPIVRNLLIANVVLLILNQMLGGTLNHLFGLRFILSDQFMPWQFVGYMWMHGDFWHLFSNMFAIFIFGPTLERMWGARKFLTFYLICGVGAGVLYAGVEYAGAYSELKAAKEFIQAPSPEKFEKFVVKELDEGLRRGNSEMLSELIEQYYNNPSQYEQVAIRNVESAYELRTQGNTLGMVGASGAVFGILMAFGMIFPNMQLMLLIPPIPVKAKYLIFFYGVYELYQEFNRVEGDNVAHLAHLGGMLIAFIILKVWKQETNKYY